MLFGADPTQSGAPSPTGGAQPGGAQPGGVPWWMKLLAPQMPGMGAMDPQQQKAMAQQNMLQMGLGMMSAGGPQKGPGMGFGQGLMQAYGGTMGNYQQLMQQAYQNQLRKSAMEQAATESQKDRDLQGRIADQRERALDKRAQAETAQRDRIHTENMERFRLQEQAAVRELEHRYPKLKWHVDSGVGYGVDSETGDVREVKNLSSYSMLGGLGTADPTAVDPDMAAMMQALRELAGDGEGARQPSPASQPAPGPGGLTHRWDSSLGEPGGLRGWARRITDPKKLEMYRRLGDPTPLWTRNSWRK